jgi:SAM-dependent methyltransferase
MAVGERLLLILSRSPISGDYMGPDAAARREDPLNLLTEEYPDLSTFVTGKRVADFGCGTGLQSISLSTRYHCQVVGVDTNLQTLRIAEANARRAGVAPEVLGFVPEVPREMRGTFDAVISQDSFEHFADPVTALGEMSGLLKESGALLLTFGPPWFAPYGSHMHFFCRVPWLNVFFSEETVMNVRRRFRTDGARRYEEVESGLNKMTVGRFESIVSSSGLTVGRRRYLCVKRMNWLAGVPVLREFFITRITVVLSKAS